MSENGEHPAGAKAAEVRSGMFLGPAPVATATHIAQLPDGAKRVGVQFESTNGSFMFLLEAGHARGFAEAILTAARDAEATGLTIAGPEALEALPNIDPEARRNGA